MCGVIGMFKKNENVNMDVIYQMEDQISRGQEGFGIIFIQDDGSYKVERATEINKALLDLYRDSNQCKMIIAHHRTPTSSENKIKQTHPILVDNLKLKHKYLIIHNGVIHNTDERKLEHEKNGFMYTTENTLS